MKCPVSVNQPPKPLALPSATAVTINRFEMRICRDIDTGMFHILHHQFINIVGMKIKLLQSLYWSYFYYGDGYTVLFHQ